MKFRFVASIVLGLLVVAAIVAIGAHAFNLGLAQGMAVSGKLDAPVTGVAPALPVAPFAYRAYGWGMHRPGFGVLGCLVPLVFLFLFFGMMRAMVWRGRWGMMHHHGKCEGGVPPMVEEWHRKMHEQSTPKPTEEK